MSCGCCCKQRQSGDDRASETRRCCICHPYQDGYLMTAQILSIIAFCMSWVWWVTLILSFPVMVMLQVVWCCKMKKCGLKTIGIFSLLCAIGSLFAGVWMIVGWKNQISCSVFTLTANYDGYWTNLGYSTSEDYCREGVWALVAFINCALFMTTTYCIHHFIVHRFDTVANKAKNNHDNDQTVIELGTVAPTSAAPMENGSETSEIAAYATAYKPPDVEQAKEIV